MDRTVGKFAIVELCRCPIVELCLMTAISMSLGGHVNNNINNQKKQWLKEMLINNNNNLTNVNSNSSNSIQIHNSTHGNQLQ